MLKAVIFDLNGIFIKAPKLTRRLWDDFGISDDESLPALLQVMNEVRLPGARDVFSYWQPYLTKWKISLSREAFLDYWFRDSEKAEPDMFALVAKLKKQGLKIFILSNNFSERAAFYTEHFPELMQLADKIYYSWQTGYLKKDPRAYKQVLRENGLKPSECVFFDDSEENITVAGKLGVQSYLFKKPEDVTNVLGR